MPWEMPGEYQYVDGTGNKQGQDCGFGPSVQQVNPVNLYLEIYIVLLLGHSLFIHEMKSLSNGAFLAASINILSSVGCNKITGVVCQRKGCRA